jgi:hypothetical protein
MWRTRSKQETLVPGSVESSEPIIADCRLWVDLLFLWKREKFHMEREEIFRVTNLMNFVSMHLAYRRERNTDKFPHHGDMLGLENR